MRRFYCHTEKKLPLHHIFEEKKKPFKFIAKFNFSSVPVMQTSFDKRLND
jgi:hypothetical protein